MRSIIPFVDSGSSAMEKASEKLAPSCPKAKLLDGKVFKSNASKAELNEWAASICV